MTTTNLGMTLPTVGGDTDNWGGELNTNLGLVDTFAGKLMPGAEAGLSSAPTTDIGSATSTAVVISGTTTITSLGSAANCIRFVRFSGALTLTHNATSLILLGGASRKTAAGDLGIYRSDSGGNWRELSYEMAVTPFLDIYLGVSNSSFSGATVTQIPFDTVTRDTHGWWNNSTKRYTPQVPGRYRVTVSVFMSGGTTGTVMNASLLETYARKNNAIVTRQIVRTQTAINNPNGATGSVTVEVAMNGSTDYFDAACYSDLTSPGYVGNPGSRSVDTWMQVVYVGPTL